MSESNTTPVESTPTDGPKIPEFVEWLAGVSIAIGGLGLIVGGAALSFVIDRELLAEGVESDQITFVLIERDLSEAEMVALSGDIVTWTGWGLLLTGLVMVVFAIGYVFARHRAYQTAADPYAARSFRSHAVLGALITGLTSFLPFSPVIGGGVAGYLESFRSDQTVRVGALAGLLALAPILLILVFVSLGLAIGMAGVNATGIGIVSGTAVLIAVLSMSVIGAGLGALGGFAADRLVE